MTTDSRRKVVLDLRRARRRDPVLVLALLLVSAGVVLSWATIDVEWEHPVSGRSIVDIREGAAAEFIPHPLRVTDQK
ncbi:MAG: hypothetical protein QGF59_16880, partial [Pirellulaceae bacterium]|nr:hypothetical protein [Pirellulaceae bacterium]